MKFYLANPSSPLPCHLSRLGTTDPWDIHLGSASHSLSCNRVGKPQGLLYRLHIEFLWCLQASTVLGSTCEGALKPHFTDSCGSLGMCHACSLPPRPLETWTSWPDGGTVLASGIRQSLDDVLVWSVLFCFSQVFQSWRPALKSMRGSKTASGVRDKESWLHPLQGMTLGNMLTLSFGSYISKMGSVTGLQRYHELAAWDSSEFSVWDKHSLDDSSYYLDYFMGLTPVVSPWAI